MYVHKTIIHYVSKITILKFNSLQLAVTGCKNVVFAAVFFYFVLTLNNLNTNVQF